MRSEAISGLEIASPAVLFLVHWCKQPCPPDDALVTKVGDPIKTQEPQPEAALATKEDDPIATQESPPDTQRTEAPPLTQSDSLDDSQGTKDA